MNGSLRTGRRLSKDESRVSRDSGQACRSMNDIRKRYMGESGFDEAFVLEESWEESGGLCGEGAAEDSDAAFLLIHPVVPFSSRTRSQPGFSARISKLFFM